MVDRYDFEVEKSNYGEYVTFEDYEQLENELQAALTELDTLQDTYSDLLDEYEDLKWRMGGLEK